MKVLATWKFPKNKSDIEWDTESTDVNAFHTFQTNAISEEWTMNLKIRLTWNWQFLAIPYAILQFPFYQLGIE